MDSGPEHLCFYQIFNHSGVNGTAGAGLQKDKEGE
jgi:hypothetical protein